MDQPSRPLVEVSRTYRVTGVEPVPDSARCPLDPEQAQVCLRGHDGELRPWWVSVKGRRMRGKTAGTYNTGGYHIDDDGVVEPDYRTGPSPAWVQDIVRVAITEQAQAQAQTAVPAGLPAAWQDLFEGLTLLARHHNNDTSPFNCSHDQLTVMADPARFSAGETARLEKLGFHADSSGEVFASFRFGSA